MAVDPMPTAVPARARATGSPIALLALVTAMTVELVRMSGPLIDVAFSSGVATAAVTAVGTYAAAGLFVLATSARRALDGRVVLLAVVALAVGRLAVQGLAGPVRYGVALACVALGVAVLVTVASSVGRISGAAVVAGLTLGSLGAAGVSLALSTWDAVWRPGLLGWLVPCALAAGALLLAGRMRGAPAAPAVRGLWLIGPYLALSVMVTANPAFVASQADVHLAVAGAVVLVSTVCIVVLLGRSLVDVDALSARLDWVLVAVLAAAAAGVFFLAPWPTTPGTLASAVILVCVTALAVSCALALAQAFTRPVHTQGSLRLAGTASCTGLGLILPLLVYQLDYELPLGVSNALVPVGVASLIAVMGLRARRRTRTLRNEISVDIEPVARRPRIRMGVTVAAVTVLGMVVVSVPGSAEQVDRDPSTVRLLSWNLHYGVSSRPAVDLDELVRTVAASGADVVTLQEVSRGWVMGGGADMASYLADGLGMEFVFVPAADRQFGNAILWKSYLGELEDVTRTALPYGMGPQRRSAVSGTLDMGGVPLRITSVHLQHRVQNTPTRLDQLDTLLAAEPVTGAYVLAGDLNAEPGWSENQHLGDAGLTSAQDVAGDASAATHPSDDPESRIDWIYGSGVTFTDFEILDTVLSDHLPLVTTLVVDSDAQAAR